MPVHPFVASHGPHTWNSPRNKVEPLEPLMGCRPWDQSSEARPAGPCEVCGGLAFDPAFVCLGCLKVARTLQARLTADRWPSTEPPKEPRPLTAKQKARVVAKLTRKEKRSLVHAARGLADGERWLKELGLNAAG